MATHPTFVAQLLRAYHGRDAVSPEQVQQLSIDQIRYLCDVGLGPIAFHTYGDVLRDTNHEHYSMLQSADLTTRVLYAQLENAVADILANLQEVAVIPVLLKASQRLGNTIRHHTCG